MINQNRFTKPDRIVTIAVDVQKDFCPGGALGVADGDSVIPPLNTALAYTRQENGLVLATRDWHPEVTPHFEAYGGIWKTHCVQNTEGAEFHPDLDIDEATVIINKGMGQTDGYSGYEGATADGKTIAEIVTPATRYERVAVAIGGLATDYCDLTTILDATEHARKVQDARQGVIDIYALTDAMRAVNIHPEDESAALEQMRQAGAHLVTTAQFMEATR